jgi:aspartate 1-decarboxylase
VRPSVAVRAGADRAVVAAAVGEFARMHYFKPPPDVARAVGYATQSTRDEVKTMRWLMRSKIHNATVTQANLSYIGSITIDADLLDKVGLWAGERVLVVSNTSGARLETYVIAGSAGSGDICMNGAAAHLIAEGEQIIIMGFELSDRPLSPRAALVDADNRFVRYLTETPGATVEAFAPAFT